MLVARIITGTRTSVSPLPSSPMNSSSNSNISLLSLLADAWFNPAKLHPKGESKEMGLFSVRTSLKLHHGITQTSRPSVATSFFVLLLLEATFSFCLRWRSWSQEAWSLIVFLAHPSDSLVLLLLLLQARSWNALRRVCIINSRRIMHTLAI